MFGRMGLRLSFTWVVGLTLFSLLTLFGTRATATAAAPVLLAIAVTAGMALIVPVRTLRQRIRDAKAVERVRLDGEIRRLRDETARGEHSADGRIADLCALRERVEAVRDWPFGSLMLLEFVLHLMIPLAPFFGGALVHHLVSRVFDPGK
jgi:pilus assembly protein TadC